MTLAENILSYVEYLNGPVGLQVSLCQIHDSYAPYLHLLYPYNRHTNPYCITIKGHGATNRCIICQRELLATASTPFDTVCWAGVGKRIYPICVEGSPLGFISVSGYLPEQEHRDYITAVSQSCGIKEEDVYKARRSLSPDRQSTEFLDTLIYPLLHMLTLLYKEQPQSLPMGKAGVSYCSIIDYIAGHLGDTLTLSELSRELGYSESHIRHLFRKYSGQTLTKYVNSMRVRRAKELLTSTQMSVTEIADAVGYPDPNYFSSVFRIHTGCSPRDYRRSNQ